MSLLSNAGVLLGKELRTEFRSRELLVTTAIFILTVLVLFSFTFDPSASETRRFGAGLLYRLKTAPFGAAKIDGSG